MIEHDRSSTILGAVVSTPSEAEGGPLTTGVPQGQQVRGNHLHHSSEVHRTEDFSTQGSPLIRKDA